MRFVKGGIAGIIAGLVFGMMMQMMAAPDGKPMMAMVAQVVRSESLVVGWLYHLFNSAVIGIIFVVLLDNRINGYGSNVFFGILYGVAWWVLGAMILMPLFLGMPPFAALMMSSMLPVALGSLMGHILYGVILSIGYMLLKRGSQ
ncbi:MAG: hypothetical protein KatS3mg006_0007 [Pyrinomonadaceae bacterium]|nr:MAG: hypothetical protein KatS3mg006_0007 [Pyrinomonadaceae bacterium]